MKNVKLNLRSYMNFNLQFLKLFLIIFSVSSCSTFQKSLSPENTEIKYPNSEFPNGENVNMLIKEIENKRILIANVMENIKHVNNSFNKEIDSSQIPTFNQVNNDISKNLNLATGSNDKKYEESLNLIATQVYNIQKESENFKKLFRNMIDMEEYFQKSLNEMNTTFESLKLKASYGGVTTSQLINGDYQQNISNRENILNGNQNKMMNRFNNKIERIVFRTRVDKSNIKDLK